MKKAHAILAKLDTITAGAKPEEPCPACKGTGVHNITLVGEVPPPGGRCGMCHGTGKRVAGGDERVREG
jgi:hypothetical protein